MEPTTTERLARLIYSLVLEGHFAEYDDAIQFVLREFGQTTTYEQIEDAMERVI